MLQPGVTKWTVADATWVQSAPDTKRGTVMVLDAQTHVSENMDKKR